MLPDTLSFVDVETTGLSPARDRIIEIAIIRMKNGVVDKTYESLINPGCSIPREITMITGIHADQLNHAPTFNNIYEEIRDLLSGAVFVAHNARFDYSFIKSEFSRMEHSFTAPILCTAKLSRRLFPQHRHHGLDHLIERFNLTCQSRHRALGDARAIADFYQIMSQQYSEKILTDAIGYVTKTSSYPPNISKKTINALPESPGVYIFYGKDGSPLYIGKSINIRDRVKSHFYDYESSTKEARIFHEVTSINHKKTHGELGALLLESKLIKEFKPTYNRMLRQQNEMTALLETTTKDGYRTVQPRLLQEMESGDIFHILGVFRNEKQVKQKLAELSDEFHLCRKLLGVEKTSGRCFGSQIQTCFGACTGKELPAKYNMRFVAAFSKTKIKPWPFSGPIAITEGETSHIIHNWCYRGVMTDDDASLSESDIFDYDTYKILASYILKKSRDYQIRLLPHQVDDFHSSDDAA